MTSGANGHSAVGVPKRSTATRFAAAIVAATDSRGRVLLVRQRAGAFAGSWLLPGGRVEPGERPAAAAEREVREETGCRVRQAHPVAAYDVQVLDAGWTVHLYRGLASGLARAEDGSAVMWVDPRSTGLHPSLRLALVDAGLRRDDPAAVARARANLGIRMARLR